MNTIWTPKILLPSLLTADPRLDAARIALERQLQLLSEASRECLFLPRLDILPEHVLDLLAEQYHVDFYEPLGMSVEVKRDFIRNAILWHRFKGTPKAVETVLSRAFSLANVAEWFEYEGDPYFFRIHIDITSDDEDTDRDTLNRLRKAVRESKNARSWLEYYNFRLDSQDSLEPPVETQHFVARPDLFDRYDYRRQAPDFDGAFSFDGAAMHGGVQADNFEDVSIWQLSMTHADNASVSDDNAFHARLLPVGDTLLVDDEYAAFPHLAHHDSVAVEEDIPVAVTLAVEERASVDDILLANIHLPALDSVAPYDDAMLELTQIFRFDGVFEFDGAIDYGATIEGETIFVTDDEDQRQWALLQRELERDFDEPCTCGACDYNWCYSSIRLGEERFLQSDPQFVTVKIKCARCGHSIVEYLVPSDDWEVRT